jgi:hypothetical protein
MNGFKYIDYLQKSFERLDINWMTILIIINIENQP